MSKIEEFKKLGFYEEDLIVHPDGRVEIGYVDEFRGLARKLTELSKQTPGPDPEAGKVANEIASDDQNKKRAD